MLDIFFLPANIIPTIAFLIIVLYWLIVLLGAVDMDFIDFDVDIDTDAGYDADAEMDSSNLFGFNKVLAFFNLGKIPFMVFLTFFILPWWFCTILINNWLGNSSLIAGLLIALPVLIGSLFISKILTTPFVGIFKHLDKEDGHMDVLGNIGEVTMKANKALTGQGEFHINNAYIKIKIRPKDNIEVLPGDKVMIVDDRQKTNFYTIEPYNELD